MVPGGIFRFLPKTSLLRTDFSVTNRLAAALTMSGSATFARPMQKLTKAAQ
jgi:hypothetical protein